MLSGNNISSKSLGKYVAMMIVKYETGVDYGVLYIPESGTTGTFPTAWFKADTEDEATSKAVQIAKQKGWL
jgi:hypothetical protein